MHVQVRTQAKDLEAESDEDELNKEDFMVPDRLNASWGLVCLLNTTATEPRQYIIRECTLRILTWVHIHERKQISNRSSWQAVCIHILWILEAVVSLNGLEYWRTYFKLIRLLKDAVNFLNFTSANINIIRVIQNLIVNCTLNGLLVKWFLVDSGGDSCWCGDILRWRPFLVQVRRRNCCNRRRFEEGSLIQMAAPWSQEVRDNASCCYPRPSVFHRTCIVARVPNWSSCCKTIYRYLIKPKDCSLVAG